MTGFFSWLAGRRQATGAEAAGRAQAGALMATVQATLDDQRRARAVDHRRQIYVQFLEVAEELLLTVPSSGGEEVFTSLAPRLATARGAIEIEGPREVARAAKEYMNGLLVGGRTRHCFGEQGPQRVADLRLAYLAVMRRALNEA
ncbi:hypothetical protein KV205_26650 [Streptomyces sp. SKN60]|uniref:hypothetical protein n=1 Tax=Streptomyces sp. SKN60 TaxID=2855506 RepID=UPI002245774B|nr:hypothetical protein [Streptomyces sp. SKN60]MCX2184083.1 hypothetical protein [Streptomyces sp. SKN60]